MCTFNNDDFNCYQLRAQLLTFGIEFKRIENNQEHTTKPIIFDIREYISSLSMGQKTLLSEVCKAMKLCVVHASNKCNFKISFSALRRVKY